MQIFTCIVLDIPVCAIAYLNSSTPSHRWCIQNLEFWEDGIDTFTYFEMIRNNLSFLRGELNIYEQNSQASYSISKHSFKTYLASGNFNEWRAIRSSAVVILAKRVSSVWRSRISCHHRRVLQRNLFLSSCKTRSYHYQLDGNSSASVSRIPKRDSPTLKRITVTRWCARRCRSSSSSL